jgi:hypothetical protein
MALRQRSGVGMATAFLDDMFAMLIEGVSK